MCSATFWYIPRKPAIQLGALHAGAPRHEPGDVAILIRAQLLGAEPRQEVLAVAVSPSIDLGETEEESVVLGGRAGHVAGAGGGGGGGQGRGVPEAGGLLVNPSLHPSPPSSFLP